MFSRDQLLDLVWGQNQDVELRTVDATIRRLRRALNAGGEPDLLRTVRATGYALDHATIARHAVGSGRSAGRRLPESRSAHKTGASRLQVGVDRLSQSPNSQNPNGEDNTSHH